MLYSYGNYLVGPQTAEVKVWDRRERYVKSCRLDPRRDEFSEKAAYTPSFS